MRKVWSIMLFVVMMVGMATSVAASGFKDVRGTWYETEVNALASKGVIAGTSATTFSPGQDVTRGQFAAFVARALDLPFGGRNNFNDINGANPFYIELNKLGQAGIMTGDDQGNSNWNSPITRVEATAIIDRMLQVEGIKTDSYKKPLTFRDNHAIPAWANESVGNMVGLEIVAGMPDGTFSGNVKVSRATAAVLLYRAFEVIDSGERNKEDSIDGVRYLGKEDEAATMYYDFSKNKFINGALINNVYSRNFLMDSFDDYSGNAPAWFYTNSNEISTVFFENWIGQELTSEKGLVLEFYLYHKEDLPHGVHSGVEGEPFKVIPLETIGIIEIDVSNEEFDVIGYDVKVVNKSTEPLIAIMGIDFRFSVK